MTTPRPVRSDGYVQIKVDGHPRASKGFVLEHIIIAERAIGRLLRAGEEVHHVNQMRRDNRQQNLVVCRRDYHMLLHARKRALLACGNANWRPCCICHRYDDSARMISAANGAMRHAACHSLYEKNRRITIGVSERERAYRENYRREHREVLNRKQRERTRANYARIVAERALSQPEGGR